MQLRLRHAAGRSMMLAALVLATQQLSASEYGCTVMLCLSNPAGPTAVRECVPFIEQLLDDLRRGRALPGCEESNGAAQLRVVSARYPDCPGGTTMLGPGAVAIDATQANASALEGQPPTHTGIGDGSTGYAPTSDGAPPEKICVGQPQGERLIDVAIAGAEGAMQRIAVPVYATVLRLPASAGGLSVIVNGQTYRTVNLR